MAIACYHIHSNVIRRSWPIERYTPTRRKRSPSTTVVANNIPNAVVSTQSNSVPPAPIPVQFHPQKKQTSPNRKPPSFTHHHRSFLIFPHLPRTLLLLLPSSAAAAAPASVFQPQSPQRLAVASILLVHVSAPSRPRDRRSSERFTTSSVHVTATKAAVSSGSWCGYGDC